MISSSKSFALFLLLIVSQQTVEAKPIQERGNKLLLSRITSTLHLPHGNLSKRQDPSGIILAPTDDQAVKVFASVRAGNNQEFKQVLVNTASGILWVGGQDAYQVGPNTEDINANFSVSYGLGSATGKAFKDTVTIGGATASSQIIGAASGVSGFDLVQPIDGVLGLGPSQSNGGEVSGFDTTPTFVDTLVSQGSIAHAMYGLFIPPLSDTGESAGEISFGGPNPDRFTGEVEWLDQSSPIDSRWTFECSGLSFGNVTSSNNAIPGQTNTGTLGINLPIEILLQINSVFGSTFIDNGPLNGLLSLPAPPPEAMFTTYPPLTFTLGSQEFSIDSEQYFIPKNLYAQFNLSDTAQVPVDPQNPQGDQKEINVAHTWISSGAASIGLGQKFLEKVYTAYDLENHRVGFAHLK